MISAAFRVPVDRMPRFAANLTWLFTEYSFLDRFEAAAGLPIRCCRGAVSLRLSGRRHRQMPRTYQAYYGTDQHAARKYCRRSRLAALADRANDFVKASHARHITRKRPTRGGCMSWQGW